MILANQRDAPFKTTIGHRKKSNLKYSDLPYFYWMKNGYEKY
jgi:hypothetical protein